MCLWERGRDTETEKERERKRERETDSKLYHFVKTKLTTSTTFHKCIFTDSKGQIVQKQSNCFTNCGQIKYKFVPLIFGVKNSIRSRKCKYYNRYKHIKSCTFTYVLILWFLRTCLMVQPWGLGGCRVTTCGQNKYVHWITVCGKRNKNGTYFVLSAPAITETLISWSCWPVKNITRQKKSAGVSDVNLQEQFCIFFYSSHKRHQGVIKTSQRFIEESKHDSRWGSVTSADSHRHSA